MNQIKNDHTALIQSGHRIISASRRTDIPAFYLKWFMDRIRQGFFNVTNPYNKVTKRFDARPENVHTIVFWSKNYEPFLKSFANDELKTMGFNLFFHFTINSESKLLEPVVPPLKKRLLQLEQLCKKNDPKNIVWRFDPVCYYKTSSGLIENNLSDFVKITEKVSSLGISSCISSFADNYKKIGIRVRFLKNKGINAPELIKIKAAKKIELIRRMARVLKKKTLLLHCVVKKSFF